MFLPIVAGCLAMVLAALLIARRDDKRREDAWLRALDEDRAKVRSALGHSVIDLPLVERELMTWKEREHASPLDEEVWR